jgi:hypothetical protein
MLFSVSCQEAPGEAATVGSNADGQSGSCGCCSQSQQSGHGLKVSLMPFRLQNHSKVHVFFHSSTNWLIPPQSPHFSESWNSYHSQGYIPIMTSHISYCLLMTTMFHSRLYPQKMVGSNTPSKTYLTTHDTWNSHLNANLVRGFPSHAKGNGGQFPLNIPNLW